MINVLKVVVPAALLVAGIGVSTAGAAPAAGGLTPLKTLSATTTLAEKTYWTKRCWVDRRGYRHCKRVWVRRPHGHRY